MGYLRGFIPWIASGVISSFDWRWGAVAGLVTGLLLLWQDNRRGIPLDSEILEISAICYFVAIGALAFASPDSAVGTYDDAVSFGWLSLTAWGGLALRRPFTLGIARRQTPREYWEEPGFLHVNNVITAVWGSGFVFVGLSLTLCHVMDAASWIGIAAHVVGLAGPAVFTSVYSARAQARAEALIAGTPA